MIVTGDRRRREAVLSFWGEMSTLEESWAISAGTSEFLYNASTPTNHTLVNSIWAFIFCWTNLMFLGFDFRKYRVLVAINTVHKVFAVSTLVERMLSSLKK